MGAGTVIKSISPALSAIPFVGGILSAAGTIAGGALESSEAEKQKEQAERVRKEALGTKPQKIQDEYLAKLRMQKMAALSGLPSLPYDIEKLGNQTANTARSIRESSPNGAATLAAMSAAKGLENSSLQDILSKNETFKTNALSTVANTLGEVGAEKQSLQDKANKIREQGLMAASALDAAGTYNKMGGINKILGAVGSTAASFGKMGGGDTTGEMKTQTTTDNATPMGATSISSVGATSGTGLDEKPYDATDESYTPTQGISVNIGGKEYKLSRINNATQNSEYSIDGVNWVDENGNPV